MVSFAICEPISIFLPAFDAWLLRQAGHQFDMARATSVYASLVGPAMMIVGGLVAARARSEELRVASEAEAQIAKNRLLQGQVHPHVLFNALNGLAELVHKDPRAAEDAIRHLSDLLRRILRATEHMRMPLREERKIVADYLALEAIRLGDRLRVRWEWDEVLDAIEIPPLLLQPLVENAIKHGIAPSVLGGELVIRAHAEGRVIRLEVWNSGAAFRETGISSGIGVRNLRSRLALHFGSAAELLLGPSEQGTLACIRFEATQVEFLHEAAEGPGC
jgi:LytS/YehU family sensor histidine kinase